jgi:hypothetical protein
MFTRGGGPLVARAVLDGHFGEAVVNAARSAQRTDDLVAAVRAELARRPPAAALAALEHARPALGARTATTAAALSADWLADGSLAGLEPEQAVALLRIVGANAPAELVDRLVGAPAVARLALAERRLEAEIHGRAAALNPGLMPPGTLVDRLRTEWDFAAAYARDPDAARLRELADVLGGLGASEAYKLLQAIDRRLSDTTRAKLALDVVVRLEPRQRLPALQQYAPRDGDRDPRWSRAAVEALVEYTLRTRERQTALVTIDSLALPASSDPRVSLWRELGLALRPYSFAGQVRAALRTVRAFASAEDRDAALELTVDAGARALVGDREGWWEAMQALADARLEGSPVFAARLARAANRTGDEDRRLIALRTIYWIADLLDNREIGRGELGRAPFSTLHRRLHEIDLETLEDVAKHRSRGQGQKWLKDNVKALARDDA